MSRKIPRINIRERIDAWRQGWNTPAAAARRRVLFTMVKVSLVLGLLVGAGASLRYAEVYVKTTTPITDGTLKLLDKPSWVNWDLEQRIIQAAGGSRLPIKEETAGVVQRNLSRVSWLADVNVDVTNDTVLVKAHWRRPMALLQKDSKKYYVDKDLYILDYMPMTDLPIVEIKGVSMSFPPEAGKKIDCNDLAVAVKLIDLLSAMDAKYYANKNPILERINDINVSNYKGIKNHRESHIVLNSKDGSQVLWGAELGDWAMYMEAKDDEKLAKLYGYFREYGSLGSGVKYIDLRNPHDVPQPIDKYR